MTYITGTIAATLNPAADLYAALASSFIAAGYTLVDTVVISARTHKIYKSAAANNVVGKDWYLDVVYTTTGAGAVQFFPMEFFDPTTDLAYRQADASGSSTFETTYFSRYGATGYALEAAQWTYNGSTTGTATQLATSTSTFGYWVSITGNRVIAMTSVEVTGMVYAGFYTPTAAYAARAGANIFPLVMVKLFTTYSRADTLITRLPPLTSMGGLGWSTGNIVATYHVNTSGFPRIPDGLAGIMAGPTMTTFDVTWGAVATPGAGTGAYPSGLLGRLDGLFWASAAPTVVRGDTVLVGSDLHVLTTGSNNTALVMRAA